MTQDEGRKNLRNEVDGLVAEARAFRKRNTLVYTDLIISLIAERLADVTEEMDRAGEAVIPPAWPRRVDLAAAVFRAMLSASALGKGGKP